MFDEIELSYDYKKIQKKGEFEGWNENSDFFIK